MKDQNQYFLEQEFARDPDQHFLGQAIAASTHSRCLSVQVGAVITKGTWILSVGSNRSPSLSHNCKNQGFCYEGVESCSSSDKPSVAIHAEAAAIAFAAKTGISVEGATIYVTHQPCINCLKLIIGTGISELVFDQPLPSKDPILWDLLVQSSGIIVRQVSYGAAIAV